MQHYGCPTRLLDVTCSPFIAMFFALDSGTAEASLYALSATHFKKIDGNELLTEDDVKEFFISGNDGSSQVALYSPKWRSERISIQQGLFLVPSNLQKPIADILEDYLPNEYQAIKFKIPVSMRKESMRRLLDMNLTSATLYPGLEGYCKSLRNLLMHQCDIPASKRKKKPNNSIQRTPLTLRR